MDYTSPKLYSKAKSGKIRFWCVAAANGIVTMTYGDVGGTPVSQSYVASPTNVGRANERDSAAQAVFEAKSAYENKLARKYSLTPEEAEQALSHLPMLAKPFDKKKKDGTYQITGDGKRFTFPAYCQPKYDGFRCLACWEGGDVALSSRNGKPFDLPHLSEQLRSILPQDVVFDGELYLHGRNATTISSLIKRQQPESRNVTYVVYDCILPDYDAQYGERFDTINNTAIGTTDHVVLATTILVDDLDEARELQSRWIAEGYEGAILRAPDLKYRYAYRSGRLLKLKVFEDAEFQIASVIEKKHKMAKFLCYVHGREGEPVTKHNTFGVTMGSHEERKYQLLHPDEFVGRSLTVRYAFLTDEQKPFHPVGVMLREEWDK